MYTLIFYLLYFTNQYQNFSNVKVPQLIDQYLINQQLIAISVIVIF